MLDLAVRDKYFYNDIKGETTVEEFLNILDRPENEGKLLELINGNIVAMAGNANINHHRISSHLASKIYAYLEGKQCEVFQDMNVFLLKDKFGKFKNVFQPDIMVGCDKYKMVLSGYEGAPEFIAEIVSKSTASYDYLVKTLHYLRAGVKEYWIVDLYQNQIVVYLNGGEEPPIVRAYTFNDRIKISIFDDLWIDFKEILKTVDLDLK